MKRYVSWLLGLAFFLLLLNTGKHEAVVSCTQERVQACMSVYHADNRSCDNALGLQLDHPYIELSRAVDSQGSQKISKLKNYFFTIHIDLVGKCYLQDLLQAFNTVNNKFLVKDTHYIYRLRKILI